MKKDFDVLWEISLDELCAWSGASELRVRMDLQRLYYAALRKKTRRKKKVLK